MNHRLIILLREARSILSKEELGDLLITCLDATYEEEPLHKVLVSTTLRINLGYYSNGDRLFRLLDNLVA